MEQKGPFSLKTKGEKKPLREGMKVTVDHRRTHRPQEGSSGTKRNKKRTKEKSLGSTPKKKISKGRHRGTASAPGGNMLLCVFREPLPRKNGGRKGE